MNDVTQAVNSVTCQPQSTLQANISVTPAALARIKEMIAQAGKGIGLRIGLKKSGCSGYSYVPEIIETFNTNDVSIEIGENLYICVAQENLPMVQNMTLDYVKEGLNKRFQFINPNAKNLCGCGESFNF